MIVSSRWIRIVILFAVLLSLHALAGCTGPAEEKESPAVLVAVTIPPQAEMVQEIGGGRVGVVVLVPPGSDPHTYEPSLGLVREASGADLYLKLGSGLFPVEDMLATRLKEMNPDLVIVDTSAGIEYLGPEGKRDPHVWLSLKNAATMAENVRDALVLADPPSREIYGENSLHYIARIRQLDQGISAEFSENDPGLILTTHEAWDYFARDYNLTIVSIERNGKEPTAQELRDLISQGRRQGVTRVFAEAQENRREAEVVAAELGATVIIIDPLSPDYLASMEQAAEAFAGS